MYASIICQSLVSRYYQDRYTDGLMRFPPGFSVSASVSNAVFTALEIVTTKLKSLNYVVLQCE